MPVLTPGAQGFYLNRNRTYDPSLGRFLQADPNASALPMLTAYLMSGGNPALDFMSFDLQGHYGDGMNLYQYVHSNPITGRDPMGLEDFDWFEESDDIMASIYGEPAAAAAGVKDNINMGLEVSEFLGSALISLLPGGDALKLMGMNTLGMQAGMGDYARAAASLIPGSGNLGQNAERRGGHASKDGIERRQCSQSDTDYWQILRKPSCLADVPSGQVLGTYGQDGSDSASAWVPSRTSPATKGDWHMVWRAGNWKKYFKGVPDKLQEATNILLESLATSKGSSVI